MTDTVGFCWLVLEPGIISTVQRGCLLEGPVRIVARFQSPVSSPIEWPILRNCTTPRTGHWFSLQCIDSAGHPRGINSAMFFASAAYDPARDTGALPSMLEPFVLYFDDLPFFVTSFYTYAHLLTGRRTDKHSTSVR